MRRFISWTRFILNNYLVPAIGNTIIFILYILHYLIFMPAIKMIHLCIRWVNKQTSLTNQERIRREERRWRIWDTSVDIFVRIFLFILAICIFAVHPILAILILLGLIGG
jgi:hypothetical protein